MQLDLSVLMIVIGILVFLTNAIVETIKMAFSISGTEKLNKLALGIGELVTILSYFIYIGYSGSKFIWYYFVGSIFVGFIVSLIAMLGWDKVLKMWQNSQKGSRE